MYFPLYSLYSLCIATLQKWSLDSMYCMDPQSLRSGQSPISTWPLKMAQIHFTEMIYLFISGNGHRADGDCSCAQPDSELFKKHPRCNFCPEKRDEGGGQLGK